MSNIKKFNEFLSEAIYFEEIEDVLNKIKTGTTIIISKYKENKNRTVYYRGYKNGKYWVNYSKELKPFQNDFVLFPNRHIDIISISNDNVENQEDFNDRIETMKEIDIEKSNKEKNQNYRDAYKQAMKYPNID